MTKREVPPVGGWRTPHGRAKELGADKVFEPVAEGVRPVPPGAAAPLNDRSDGKFTSETASDAARRRWEAAKLPDFGDKTAPWLPPSKELEPFDGARQELFKQRTREIHQATGAVSSGVGAQLRAWAYIHAAGEYWASQFFATADPNAFSRMVSAFKASSTEDAKLRDAAAWEAATRPKSAIPDFKALAAQLPKKDPSQ